ncbi:DNA repair protein RadC [Camelliibacillus cellulosilyticus]|uniref:DNA repair protein RadC n=1 Tax=Camelliibacillus cellulosilyticus TaxID=2174486 RepID=A0ABV9GLN7_9BACL
MIRDVLKEERPRERMLQEGPSALSNQELLAIILRTGSIDASVLTLSHRLLQRFEGLKGLKNASIEELLELKGIGTAKAVQIMAALELGKRLNTVRMDDRYAIRSPQDGVNLIADDLRHLVQEHFVCLYLNTKNQVIHRQTLFIGSLNASIVHPREVFREALKRSAASIICFHNHPSGDPTPSQQDIDVTKRLVDCGMLLGIDVLDHIIIGERDFVSLKEKGIV